MKKRFCIECDAIRPCHVEQRKIAISQKHVSYTYIEKYLVCSICGDEVYDREISDENVMARLKAYAEAAR